MPTIKHSTVTQLRRRLEWNALNLDNPATRGSKRDRAIYARRSILAELKRRRVFGGA